MIWSTNMQYAHSNFNKNLGIKAASASPYQAQPQLGRMSLGQRRNFKEAPSGRRRLAEAYWSLHLSGKRHIGWHILNHVVNIKRQPILPHQKFFCVDQEWEDGNRRKEWKESKFFTESNEMPCTWTTRILSPMQPQSCVHTDILIHSLKSHTYPPMFSFSFKSLLRVHITHQMKGYVGLKSCITYWLRDSTRIGQKRKETRTHTQESEDLDKSYS